MDNAWLKKNLFKGCCIWLLLLTNQLPAQTKFEHACDSLRGYVSDYRSCYDVTFYQLDIKIDIATQTIVGSNTITFLATQVFNQLQIDLFANLAIDKILFKNQPLNFTRTCNAVLVTFPYSISKGAIEKITIFYAGKPIVAAKPPWDGGLVYTHDTSHSPWISTACQEIGASVWWPNKDHQSDEPDSMLISVSVPDTLMDVSNGRLSEVTPIGDGYVRYNWVVSNPINNYDVCMNIAKYEHFNDCFEGINGLLTLDYYVLKHHLKKAKKHFKKQVKPLLKAFEYWFGAYPFYGDGYKLIETPFLGMEHQSAIAYGNNYELGYRGKDLSQTGYGKKWDYIIVHESAHEWFGNSITSKDIADMWLHESFADYAESLFIEYQYGKKAANAYLVGKRKNIKNDAPIIGTYNLNKKGSNDMYYKGGNLLHTIRTLVNDDRLWRDILTGLNQQFRLKTVDSEEIIQYINQKANKNFTKIFNQYLRYKNLPTLIFKIENGQIWCRWNADVVEFDMPIKIKYQHDYQWIQPQTVWTIIDVPVSYFNKIEIDDNHFYIQTSYQ